MDILKEIVAHKRIEVASRKKLYPVKCLEKRAYFERDAVSMVKYLSKTDKVGIIAEFKRKSPSKGKINSTEGVKKITVGYVQAGASGLSILTDEKYFGGKNDDLLEARTHNSCPILRKDFIIDEYQIVEAKSIGADMILLIASVLSAEEVWMMAELAKKLGLEVLLEIHNEGQLAKLCAHVDAIGVNNRDLKTFATSIEISRGLATKIPSDFLKISESGIHDANTLLDLKDHGFDGFLIGERFMSCPNPEKACSEFIQSAKSKTDPL